MSSAPKRPASKPGKASAVVAHAKRQKPVAGNMTQQEAPSATEAEPLAFSRSEKFDWLEKAALIEEVTDAEVESKEADVQDACKVRRSMNRALMTLIGFMQGESSTYRLGIKKKQGQTLNAELAADDRILALKIVSRTGSVKHWLVRALVEDALAQDDGKFFVDLAEAISSKGQPPKIKQKDLEAFLVAHWCGFPNRIGYGALIQVLKEGKIDSVKDMVAFGYKNARPIFALPPLCLFVGKTLARFCTLLSGFKHEEASYVNVRQAISRLGLKRASRPKIIDYREDPCGKIYFICDRK